MSHKNFEELTYEEKVRFIRKEFGITELNLHNIKKVITQCHVLGCINYNIIDSYEAVQNFTLEIAIRIYTDYDGLKEAYSDCTSVDSALCELEKVYITLTDSDFRKDLGNLIDKYKENYRRRG